MHEPLDLTAWSSLFLGLFTLFTGIGAFRRPQFYREYVQRMSEAATGQLLTAMCEMILGALVYLANPWVPSDLLACYAKFVGGCMIVEALMLAGFCDIYSNFWLKNLSYQPRLWASFAVGNGLLLAVPAILRFS